MTAHIATQSLKYFRGNNTQLGVERQFNLNGENNVASWFSASALLVCSELLFVIGVTRKRVGDRFAANWLGLSAGFLYLSVDEAASLHEMTIVPLRTALDLTGYLYFAWVIPGAIITLILALTYLPFLYHLPVRIRRLAVVAGALYVGGAIGVEMLGSRYYSLYGTESFQYSLLVAVEEGLEMFGVVVFIYALSLVIAALGIEVSFTTTTSV